MKKTTKYFKGVTALVMSSVVLAGCGEGILIAPTRNGVVIKAKKAQPPRIQTFDYSPKYTNGKDDIITFTVTAYDSDEGGLQYTWKSSKGTLLSNSGTTVSWKPTRADGTLETGTATITVTVSDGQSSVDASANVFINGSGKVTQDYYGSDYRDYDYNNGGAREYDYGYDRDYDHYYEDRDYEEYAGGRTVFSENFERGALEDNWSVSYGSAYSRNYLTWKIMGEVTSRSRVAILTGPTDEILRDTTHAEVKFTSTAIDLRRVRQPRLYFRTKSDSNPSTAVKLNVYWESHGRRPVPLNVSFVPDKNWGEVDVDLQNLLDRDGGTVGYLTIGAKVNGNGNTFDGPMVDDIKIYDASR